MVCLWSGSTRPQTNHALPVVRFNLGCVRDFDRGEVVSFIQERKKETYHALDNCSDFVSSLAFRVAWQYRRQPDSFAAGGSRDHYPVQLICGRPQVKDLSAVTI